MKLKVLSKVDGFRRCGVAFSSSEPTFIDMATLSKEQINTLKSDPGLVVLETERVDENKKDAGDVKILQRQLEESKAALDEATDGQSKALELVNDLKQELAKEKDAHAETKGKLETAEKAIKAAPATADGKTNKKAS